MENSNSIQADHPLTATITVNADTMRLVQRARDEVALVRDMFPDKIQSQDVADLAGQHLTGIRQRAEVLESMKEKVCAPARQIIKTMLAWFGPGLEANKEADAYVVALLSDWTLRERKRIDDAKLEAERKAREWRRLQEREAAQARAEAEERARQAAQEAARAAQQAQASQTAEAAAIAATAAQDADAAHLDAQLAAQSELDLNSQPLTLPTLPKVGKIAGIRMSDHWSAELKGPEATVKELIVLAAVDTRYDANNFEQLVIVRPELLGYLKLDRVALNRSAVALKDALNVPGVSAVNKPTPARE